MSRILSCKNLSYGTRANRVLAKHINFDIDSSTILIVKGANGSGKTTFLKVLLGEHQKLSGEVNLGVEARSVSYLPQLQSPFFHLPVTLQDLLEIDPSHSSHDYTEIGLLEDRHLSLSWKTASGGERKRTLITRALMSEPKLLILDEPFNHLDDQSKQAVTDGLIKYMKERNGAVIMVSHESEESFFEDAGIEVMTLRLGS